MSELANLVARDINGNGFAWWVSHNTFLHNTLLHHTLPPLHSLSLSNPCVRLGARTAQWHRASPVSLLKSDAYHCFCRVVPLPHLCTECRDLHGSRQQQQLAALAAAVVYHQAFCAELPNEEQQQRSHDELGSNRNTTRSAMPSQAPSAPAGSEMTGATTLWGDSPPSPPPPPTLLQRRRGAVGAQAGAPDAACDAQQRGATTPAPLDDADDREHDTFLPPQPKRLRAPPPDEQLLQRVERSPER